jgi:hypothetical protein
MKTEIKISMSQRRNIIIYFLILIGISLISVNLQSQYPVNYQYTLLPSKITDEIIGASSGDLAMLHIFELAGFNRPRSDEEFRDYPLE